MLFLIKKSIMKSKIFVDRRSFVKKTSIGVGAAAIGLSLFPDFAFASQTGKKKLGVALVGLGNYAGGQLAPALLQTKNCYLAGIVTGTKSKEAEWMTKYNIPKKNVYNYDNFDDIKKNKDIDIVYVVLPNSMHAEYTIRAAKAGKHVLCEKPMALSVDDCQRMIDACKTANVKLSVGYRLNYEPHNQKIKELARTKEFGKIKYVRSEFGFRIGDPTQWRLKKAMAGGGAVMDVGVYCIQACRMATGEEPISISAQEFKTDPVKFSDVDETVAWQMEFPSGALSNSTTSYNFSTNEYLICTENGKYGVGPAFGYGKIAGFIKDKPMGFPIVNHQATQMDAFSKNVMTDTEPIVTGDLGLRDMKIVEALYKSLASGGKRVKV
ncbi:MAG: glucose-fructose oxidoreductase [Cyclobacteriaceae bacterium]|jgi:predicted dehydrogenase